MSRDNGHRLEPPWWWWCAACRELRCRDCDLMRCEHALIVTDDRRVVLCAALMPRIEGSFEPTAT